MKYSSARQAYRLLPPVMTQYTDEVLKCQAGIQLLTYSNDAVDRWDTQEPGRHTGVSNSPEQQRLCCQLHVAPPESRWLTTTEGLHTGNSIQHRTYQNQTLPARLQRACAQFMWVVRLCMLIECVETDMLDLCGKCNVCKCWTDDWCSTCLTLLLCVSLQV